MWFFNKSYSQLPGGTSAPIRTTPKTYFLWLWKSKLVKYILLMYITFSILLPIIQLVKYTFGYGVHLPEKLERQPTRPIYRTYGKVF